MPTIQPYVRNRLLRAMTPEDFGALAPYLELVSLTAGETIQPTGYAIEHVYFPESGITSLVAQSRAGHRVETGVVGRDGVLGAPLICGVAISPLEYLVQISGEAYRVKAAPFLTSTLRSTGLRDLLLRYIHVNSVQTAFGAMSNAINPIDRRLARWLLMCRDRLSSDTLNVTHELMSIVLGVRRPGVTTALHILEGHLLIRGMRGCIAIRDRAGLEAYADDAYGSPEAEYRRLIGPMSEAHEDRPPRDRAPALAVASAAAPNW